MSFVFNGLTASVSITGGISTDTSTIPSGMTKVTKTMFYNGAGGAENTIYTQPSGTLYIQRLMVSASSNTVVKVGDNVGTTMVNGTVYDNAVMSYLATNGTAICWNFDKPLQCATKLSLFDAVGGAKNFCVSFVGWYG